jgi:chemotaxis signal transduction protein
MSEGATTQSASEKKSAAGQKLQYCTFWIAGRLYGVDILDVKEIYPDVSLTPVFHSPKEVKGYVNVRGQIHLILDLRLMLGHEDKKVDGENCLVLFKPSVAEPFGILVEKIGDVVVADRDQMEKNRPSQADVEKRSDLIDFVCKLEKTLLVVLNPKKILEYIDAEKEGI